MSVSFLDELLQLAGDIMELDRGEGSLGKGPEWKAAKQQYEDLVAQFNSVRQSFIDALLIEGRDWPDIVSSVENDLDGLEVTGDTSWADAISYLRDNLLPILKKEARKPPLLRKAAKWLPVALGVIAAVAYFGIKLTGGVDVSAPIESKLGLQQRAEAVEKLVRYDNLMGTNVRRGGWFKGILFWPIEPSDIEIKAAGEFVAVTLEGYKVLTEENKICGNLVNGTGDQLSDGQINFVDEIAEKIQDNNLSWQEPPVMTILQPIKEKFPCR